MRKDTTLRLLKEELVIVRKNFDRIRKTISNDAEIKYTEPGLSLYEEGYVDGFKHVMDFFKEWL